MRCAFPRFALAAVCLAVMAGCQSTPKEAPPPPPTVSAVVEKDFETVWTQTRDELLQQELWIYTRDKRGLFVVFTDMHRVFFVSPRRTKMTISLEPVNAQSTRITVETIKQHYRVTLLTYPDWRDVLPGTDPEQGQELLNAIVAHINGTGDESSASTAG